MRYALSCGPFRQSLGPLCLLIWSLPLYCRVFGRCFCLGLVACFQGISRIGSRSASNVLVLRAFLFVTLAKLCAVFALGGLSRVLCWSVPRSPLASRPFRGGMVGALLSMDFAFVTRCLGWGPWGA